MGRFGATISAPNVSATAILVSAVRAPAVSAPAVPALAVSVPVKLFLSKESDKKTLNSHKLNEARENIIIDIVAGKFGHIFMKISRGFKNIVFCIECHKILTKSVSVFAQKNMENNETKKKGHRDVETIQLSRIYRARKKA
uniref:Uncharacterized protein n=1 Tax=Romanomermis culicivorax TaxID=13658 RepID=A0A915HT24_ROMCU